ncbi:hypothetical protein Daus18300_004677 [Diaporthe australafricana]|uniref:Cytochrome b5 heme-binding domain-containing protein n=1 Tax=Diaporthe australafricana TaxID=127596 RepID=A0ABR3X7P4_9PEZI
MGYDYVIILLNPGLIRPLLNSNISDASRAQAHLSFALTLCHEMMHAIYRSAMLDLPRHPWSAQEPFYEQPGTSAKDSAWINELGFAWEQALIGGALGEWPLREDDWSAGGLLMFMEDFPNFDTAQGQGQGVDFADHGEDVWFGYGLPAFVAQAYSSDEFWAFHVRKYGLPALRAPKLIQSRMGLGFRSGTPQICQLEYAAQEFYLQLLNFANDFEGRRALWQILRPWYGGKYMQWVTSPYARSLLRNQAGRFRAAHRRRDEEAAQNIYDSLGAVERWGPQFNSNGYLLTQGHTWPDEAIGYLMMTIMPVRAQRSDTDFDYIQQNDWTPSNAANAYAAAQSKRPFEVLMAGSWGAHRVSLKQRNIAFDPNSDLGTRESLLRILKDEIPNRQRQFPMPNAVYQTVKAMFDNVERNAPVFGMVPDRWMPLEFNYVLPPWQSPPAQRNLGNAPSLRSYVAYNPSAQPQQYVPGAAGPGAAAPPGPQNRTAGSARRAPNAPDEGYYTVGEVGDHISTGDLWIIADDGASGYDVYNATDVIEETWADDQLAFNFDDHCERTLLGRKARPGLQQVLQAQGERLGKLIRPIRQQDIFERDGRHGKPFWIVVGNDVFDISNFPFESAHHQNLMTTRPGGNPWNAIVNDGTIDYDQLLIDLKPYRCAVVASGGLERGPGPREETIFTAKEVAWHIYPEATMYTIIRGQVYDLTGYMASHPGGETILRQWAGQDSTTLFERYHGDADRCLAEYDYLRVGRVVPEKQMDQLTDNEVEFQGHVYDPSRIPQDQQQLIGDITQELLVQRPDLITAKLAPPLREIDLDTLHANNGSHVPLPEGMRVARDRVEADPQMPIWVCYRGLVYDMTTVYKFGPDNMRWELERYGGRFKGAVIPQSALGLRLQDEYSCRVIGRLPGTNTGMRGRTRRRSEVDGDGDHDGTGRARQRPRTT